MRFSQKVAVITGGGTGIGKATAIRLANEGAKVILVGRTKSKLEETANEINATKKIPMAEIFPADVTEEEDMIELAQYVEQQYGDLHVLINNAGGSKSARILEMSAKEWDETHSINLKSIFLVTKHLAKVMINAAEKEGANKQDRTVVNVASLSGHQAGVFIPHYSCAKAAVINFTKSLALELARYGIRVNSVSPGFIETPLIEESLQNEQFVKAVQVNTVLRRVGRPDEIANVIAFLASCESTYLVGSDIVVDGGWLIK
jgi:meso-butanediol dehydrogenase / (S,S)-butanediol dehydrogenase / diacetyl reductase